MIFEEDERIVTSEYTDADVEIEAGLRPHKLEEYIGQKKAKDNLEIYIKAALDRHEALDHVLLYLILFLFIQFVYCNTLYHLPFSKK